MLYRLREGCSWRALSIFAPHTTIYTRWKQWCQQGLWDQMLSQLAARGQGQLWSIDSTSIKVHKHGFGGAESPEKQAIGRSRGGPNTKLHALVDTRGRALRVLLTPGQFHDLSVVTDLVAGQHQRTILADKAYDSDRFRQQLEDWGLKACIPPKINRRHPSPWHKGHYRRRHQVENFFQRIKEKRAIATRYEKLASRFQSLISLAAICDWLRS